MDENGINEAMEPYEDEETNLTEIEAGDSGAGAIALLIGGGIAVGVAGKAAFDKFLLPKINGWKQHRAAKKAKKQAENGVIIDVEAEPVESPSEDT